MANYEIRIASIDAEGVYCDVVRVAPVRRGENGWEQVGPVNETIDAQSTPPDQIDLNVHPADLLRRYISSLPESDVRREKLVRLLKDGKGRYSYAISNEDPFRHESLTYVERIPYTITPDGIQERDELTNKRIEEIEEIIIQHWGEEPTVRLYFDPKKKMFYGSSEDKGDVLVDAEACSRFTFRPVKGGARSYYWFHREEFEDNMNQRRDDGDS